MVNLQVPKRTMTAAATESETSGATRSRDGADASFVCSDW